MSGTTRRQPGQLGPFVESYRSYLNSLGYTPDTVRNHLSVLGHLGRWMSDRALAPADLSIEKLEVFRADARAVGFGRPVYRRGLLLLRQHLIDQGVLAAEDECPRRTPLDELVEGYRVWLVRERGLAEQTVLRYVRTARVFLSQQAPDAGICELTGAEVHAFLLVEAARCSVGAAKGRVAEMRSLLRFLFVHGHTPVALAASIPPVAGWHDTGIPPTLTAVQVQQLLGSCDRSIPLGIRDYAILLLLARLALRSIEVVRLALDDVHWRAGELTIRGKARRPDTMPLPVEVGQALADYLAVRPRSDSRQVFLTCRAPLRCMQAAMINDVVERACRRSGAPRVGPHRLRHAVATSMVREGVALTDISQVLRHRDLATTAIYAKIDFASLRAVARPWPAS